MFRNRQIWLVILPIALLALLVGTTFGGLWHHHATSSDNCPICHLSHEAIGLPDTSIHIHVLVPTGIRFEAQYRSFASNSVARDILPRAPPA